ncbi:hypothetical protein ATER59S_01874 [Aquamicrobium terrae]
MPSRFSAWLATLGACGVIGAFTACTHAPAASAEPVCMPYADLVKTLRSVGEMPSGSGVTAQGKAALLVFASPAGATWTMAVLGQDGSACVIAAGQDWLEVIPPKGPAKGAAF